MNTKALTLAKRLLSYNLPNSSNGNNNIGNGNNKSATSCTSSSDMNNNSNNSNNSIQHENNIKNVMSIDTTAISNNNSKTNRQHLENEAAKVAQVAHVINSSKHHAALIVEDILDDDVVDNTAHTANTANTANMAAMNDDDHDGSDSLASMETLSDNVSIWIDGEKHWVSGVDANTTCADLICAVLNYQLDAGLIAQTQHSQQQQQKHQTGNNVTNKSIDSNNSGNNANNQSTTTTTINTNTKEMCSSNNSSGKHTVVAAADLANNYVIVKQRHHYEEYLDSNARIFDVLPVHDTLARKECELLLRQLTACTKSPQQTKVNSLLSTDKDSGMGSPVGSSRSARLRRRKHKTTTHWLAQGNTLHPKYAERYSASANERLMKIILAQDETIHRQLTLLREKQRQIMKIEEEKHRVRERELGKNYLLETYLNALDEAETDAAPTELEASANLDATTTAPAHVSDGENLTAIEPRSQATPGQSKAATTIANPREKIKSKEKQKEKQKEKEKEKEKVKTKSKSKLLGNNNDRDNKTDLHKNEPKIDTQLYWLEKIYALNKQLQREEELLLQLHAKIRKHQVKRAYQSKSELLQQIDKLDVQLTAQLEHINGVERKLLSANEQLKAKLGVLECLSLEFECVQANERNVPYVCEVQNARHLLKLLEKPTETITTTDAQKAATAIPPAQLIDKNTQQNTCDTKLLKKQMFATTTAAAATAATTQKTSADIITTAATVHANTNANTNKQCYQNGAAPLTPLLATSASSAAHYNDITNLGTLV